MDTNAYLKNQGWRGLGYSLDHTDRGITKPLLYSQKSDQHGLGRKKHDFGDQWWLKVFDESLKGVSSRSVESILVQNRFSVGNSRSLYGSFVKGGALEGTITDSPTPPVAMASDAVQSEVPAAAVAVSAPAAADTHVNGKTPDTHVNGKTAVPANRPEILIPGMKRKRPKESAKDVRKRRRLERQDKAKHNAIAKREKALAEGTFDFEAEKEKYKARELNRRADEYVQKALRDGTLGFAPPPRNASGNVVVPANGHMHADRQAMIDSASVLPGIPLPKPGKKLSYKAEKYMREKAKRIAKRAEKERLKSIMYPKTEGGQVDTAGKHKEHDKGGESGEDVQDREYGEDEHDKENEENNEEGEEGEEGEGGEEGEEERKERAAIAKEAIKAKRAAAKAERKALRAEKRAKKLAQVEEKEKKKKEKRDQKRLRRVERVRSRAEANAAAAAAKKEKEALQDFENNPDEVRLGLTRKGRVKKVPGIGPVTKYPSASEKRQRKIEGLAAAQGITVEEYLAQKQKEMAAREVELRQKVEEYRAQKAGLTVEQYREQKAQEEQAEKEAKAINGDAEQQKPERLPRLPVYAVLGDEPASAPTAGKPRINGEVKQPSAESGFISLVVEDAPPKLSERKLQKYAAKAAEKGLSVEEYLKRREIKKARKASKEAQTEEEVDAMETEPTMVTTTVTTSTKQDVILITDPVSEYPLIASQAYTSAPGDTDATKVQSTSRITESLGFVVDTSGDPELPAQAHKPPVIPLDPEIWKGRIVKDLSKPERKARAEWMRLRRNEKKARLGITTMTKKERSRKRMAKKMETQKRLTAQILRDKGEGWVKDATKEQVKQARREARRVMRYDKKERKAQRKTGIGRSHDRI